MFMLSRSHHVEDNAVIHFLIQNGIKIQHIVSVPFYCTVILWTAAVLPSCFLYYTQVKGLHQYVANMLFVFVAYYGVILGCMLYRPATAVPLTLVISVHILEKCMVNSGEYVLYCGQSIRALFRVFAIALIGFVWIYLPIDATSSVDCVACLFAAELLGIAIVFTYHFMTGLCSFIYRCYDTE
jgi:hypothetical protein